MRIDKTEYTEKLAVNGNESCYRRALRDSRAIIALPQFWALMGAGIAISALAAPFQSHQLSGLPGRVLYWGAVIGLTSLLLTYFSMLAREVTLAARVHWAFGSLGATLVAVPPVYALIWTLHAWLDPVDYAINPSVLLLNVAVPMGLINLIVNGMLVRRDREADRRQASAVPVEPVDIPLPPILSPAPETDPAPPLLFEKLPPELGRDLICLRAQDHYVEAMTALGSAAVLMRLSDAERDLAGLAGLRVHRSWWVNLDHVTGFVRSEGGGMDLTLSNGMVIPVARGQRAALRSAIHKRRAAAE